MRAWDDAETTVLDRGVIERDPHGCERPVSGRDVSLILVPSLTGLPSDSMNNIDCIILTFGPITSTSTLITPDNRAMSSMVDEILCGNGW